MALKREEIHVICHINPDVIIAIIEQQEVRMASRNPTSRNWRLNLTRTAAGSGYPSIEDYCHQKTTLSTKSVHTALSITSGIPSWTAESHNTVWPTPEDGLSISLCVSQLIPHDRDCKTFSDVFWTSHEIRAYSGLRQSRIVTKILQKPKGEMHELLAGAQALNV